MPVALRTSRGSTITNAAPGGYCHCGSLCGKCPWASTWDHRLYVFTSPTMSPCEMYGITLYVNSSSTARVHAQPAAGNAADRTRCLVITAPVAVVLIVAVPVT